MISPKAEIETMNYKMHKCLSEDDISQMPVYITAFNDSQTDEACSDCYICKSFQYKQSYEFIAEFYIKDKIENNIIPACITNKDSKIIETVEMAEDISESMRIECVWKEREKDLKTKSYNLDELNAALRVLLKQREKDKD
jgi:hypothetical protein